VRRDGNPAPAVPFPHEAKETLHKVTYMFLLWRTGPHRTGPHRFIKKLRMRTGSDSIFSDLDWTRTQKN